MSSRLILSLLVVSPFLPLLNGSFRVDQFIFPLIFVLLLLARLKYSQVYSLFCKPVWLLLSILPLSIIASFIYIVLNSQAKVFSLSLIEDSLAFPIQYLTFSLLFSKLSKNDSNFLRLEIPRLIVIFCSLASVVAIYCFLSGDSSILAYFTPPIPEQDLPLSILIAQQSNRFIGIFNSPQAVSQFSILSLVYSWFLYTVSKSSVRSISQIVPPFILGIFAILQFTSGFLALSKNFYFCGSIIFLYILLSYPNFLKNLSSFKTKYTAFLCSILIAILCPFLYAYINYRFDINNIFAVFSSRYGSDAILYVYLDSPILLKLFGAGFWRTQHFPLFDIGYVQYIQYAGFIGLFILLIFFVSYWRSIDRFFSAFRSRFQSTFLIDTLYLNFIPISLKSVLLLMFLSMISGPSLTENRLSALYALVLNSFLSFIPVNTRSSS